MVLKYLFSYDYIKFCYLSLIFVESSYTPDFKKKKKKKKIVGRKRPALVDPRHKVLRGEELLKYPLAINAPDLKKKTTFLSVEATFTVGLIQIFP